MYSRHLRNNAENDVLLDEEDLLPLLLVLGTRYHLRWHTYYRRRSKRHPLKYWNFSRHVVFGRNGVNRQYLHRWVWERHNGPIPKGYNVHHKNGDTADNRLANLELLIHADHSKVTYREKLAKFRKAELI